MSARLASPAQLLQALPQRVVGVVGGRVDLEQLLEGLARPVVLTAVVVRPAERLELERLPWREAVAAAESGGIVDAKSIVGLFWLARLMEVDRA